MRIILVICGCLSMGLGMVGVFVPVLPTTPLILLAALLFAKSSPRLHAWLQTTWVYRNYVGAFLEAGGMPVKTKVRALLISYAVLCVSAVLVQKLAVWVVLGCVAVFLLWLFAFRIPTIDSQCVELARKAERV